MPRRLQSVDFLRGLCILAVVIHHINIRVKFNKSAFGAMLPADLNRALFFTGSQSVKVFFVISGYLITSTILTRWGELSKIDVAAFYRLRFARIAPCLLALLAILSVLHLAGAAGFTIRPERTNLPRALLAALTFHVNWLETKVGYLPGAWDILWSLSIEEAFYLAYPVLCRYLRPRYLIGLAVALIVVGPLFRSGWAANEMATDYAYLANMDCIAMGCLVAAVPALRVGRYPRIAGWVALMTILFARRFFPHRIPDMGLDVTIVAVAAALAIQARSPWFSSPLLAPVRWFGRQSYEVYLTHMFVVTLATQWFTAHKVSIDQAPALFVGIVAVSGLLGFAVMKGYSEPLNRLLRSSPSAVAKAA